MSSNSRRKYSPEFKASIAITALGGNVSIAEIARKHGLHPNLVARWRDTLRERAASLFEPRIEDGEQIARLVAERNFLSHVLGSEPAPSDGG